MEDETKRAIAAAFLLAVILCLVWIGDPVVSIIFEFVALLP